MQEHGEVRSDHELEVLTDRALSDFGRDSMLRHLDGNRKTIQRCLDEHEELGSDAG